MNRLFLAQAAPDNAAGAFGFVAGLGIIGLIIALLTTVFRIWMLVDCATNASLNGTEKIVWILVILFLHFIGALVYYFAGRRKSRTGTPAV